MCRGVFRSSPSLPSSYLSYLARRNSCNMQYMFGINGIVRCGNKSLNYHNYTWTEYGVRTRECVAMHKHHLAATSPIFYPAR
jgi:hypothetical protein